MDNVFDGKMITHYCFSVDTDIFAWLMALPTIRDKISKATAYLPVADYCELCGYVRNLQLPLHAEGVKAEIAAQPVLEIGAKNELI
mgnify:CR=1 FL=1